MDAIRREAESAKQKRLEREGRAWQVDAGVGGIGQMPAPSGSNQIVYSPQQVSSQADCAAKGGQLFDSQRLCCVKINPQTGKPEPGRQTDYGWYCAQTTFGAPVPAAYPGTPGLFTPSGAMPGAAPYYPPVASTSMLGSLPPWLPILVVIGGAMALISQQRG